jgi:hypothetical protein
MPTAPVNGTASLGEDGVLHIDIHGPLSGDRVFFEVGDVISITGAGGTAEGLERGLHEDRFPDPVPCTVQMRSHAQGQETGGSSQTLSKLATHDPLFVECTVALSGSVHTFTRIE